MNMNSVKVMKYVRGCNDKIKIQAYHYEMETFTYFYSIKDFIKWLNEVDDVYGYKVVQ